MNIAATVAQQVFIMLVLIIIGYVLTKSGNISQRGSKDMSNVLLTIVTPCVLINAYQIDYNSDVVREIGFSFFLSFAIHLLFIALSGIIFRFEKNDEKRRVGIFTSIYSNCGFMGIPLLSAALGEKGVLIGSTYLAMFNVIVWTHGLLLYGRDFHLLSMKNILKNPGVMGTAAALVMFFLRIRIGGPLKSCVDYMASLNTPLAMLLLGTYLARSDLKSSLKGGKIYIVSFVRLLLLPLMALLLMKLIHVDVFIGSALILSAACPSAAISALFAEKFGMDAGYPSEVVSVTTILSLATLPLMAFAASVLL